MTIRFPGDRFDRHGQPNAYADWLDAYDEAVADLTIRHEMHKERCQLAGERIDRALAAIDQAREVRCG